MPTSLSLSTPKQASRGLRPSSIGLLPDSLRQSFHQQRPNGPPYLSSRRTLAVTGAPSAPSIDSCLDSRLLVLPRSFLVRPRLKAFLCPYDTLPLSHACDHLQNVVLLLSFHSGFCCASLQEFGVSGVRRLASGVWLCGVLFPVVLTPSPCFGLFSHSFCFWSGFLGLCRSFWFPFPPLPLSSSVMPSTCNCTLSCHNQW